MLPAAVARSWLTTTIEKVDINNWATKLLGKQSVEVSHWCRQKSVVEDGD